jgi:hypothetical protein
MCPGHGRLSPGLAKPAAGRSLDFDEEVAGLLLGVEARVVRLAVRVGVLDLPALASAVLAHVDNSRVRHFWPLPTSSQRPGHGITRQRLPMRWMLSAQSDSDTRSQPEMSMAIASAALAVSLSTFLISWRRDKRDLFLRVHERLASVDQQRGRKLIHEMSSQRKQVEDLADDEYETINNALSMLNVECFYYVRGYISRKDMLRTWAHSIARLYVAAQPFVSYRDAQTAGARNWPALHQFALDANEYMQRRGRKAELPDRSAPDELPAS